MLLVLEHLKALQIQKQEEQCLSQHYYFCICHRNYPGFAVFIRFQATSFLDHLPHTCTTTTCPDIFVDPSSCIGAGLPLTWCTLPAAAMLKNVVISFRRQYLTPYYRI